MFFVKLLVNTYHTSHQQIGIHGESSRNNWYDAMLLNISSKKPTCKAPGDSIIACATFPSDIKVSSQKRNFILETFKILEASS